jgi:hypothetical protein
MEEEVRLISEDEATEDLSVESPIDAAIADTAVIISSTVFSLLTIEPTPTPLAPQDRASGAVTSVTPEAHMTGMVTALCMNRLG